MAKRKTKSNFVGIRLTAEQAVLLARLQQSLKSTTKTEVLLKALAFLAKSQSLAAPEVLPEIPKEVPEVATDLELSQLEVGATQYISIVHQTKSRTKEVIRQVVKELTKIDQVVDKYGSDKNALIQILLDIQRENNWLPQDALMWVSQKLSIPLTQIYHIATFYKAFSLIPQGRHSVSVCMGTACQVRGAPSLLDKVIEKLKIKPGETSKDMRFSLHTVNCVGCCALGPVLVVDGKYYSKPSTTEIGQIVTTCE